MNINYFERSGLKKYYIEFNDKYIYRILFVFSFIVIYLAFQLSQKKSQEQSFLIIGIDFGSSFSGYSILTDNSFDFESHHYNKSLYSEIILYKGQGIYIRKLDNKNQKLVFGENQRYFAHFKKFLEKNKIYENIFIESDIQKGEKTELDIIIKGFYTK